MLNILLYQGCSALVLNLFSFLLDFSRVLKSFSYSPLNASMDLSLANSVSTSWNSCNKMKTLSYRQYIMTFLNLRYLKVLVLTWIKVVDSKKKPSFDKKTTFKDPSPNLGTVVSKESNAFITAYLYSPWHAYLTVLIRENCDFRSRI